MLGVWGECTKQQTRKGTIIRQLAPANKYEQRIYCPLYENVIRASGIYMCIFLDCRVKKLGVQLLTTVHVLKGKFSFLVEPQNLNVHLNQNGSVLCNWMEYQHTFLYCARDNLNVLFLLITHESQIQHNDAGANKFH